MNNSILVRVLGDYGPFSRIGKSIGYQVTIGNSTFLVDCGSPLFKQIGGHGMKSITGLLITHCHDDHKRWFSDLALFNRYAPDMPGRLSLITSEEINDGLMRSSGSALNTSLSGDSRRIIDIAYDEYVDFRAIGPRARYRIVNEDNGDGTSRLCVQDSAGNRVGPERAKVVVSSRTGQPRLLFKDPEYNEWIEPESFYGYNSTVFYEPERNSYRSDEGFTIEAVKAPVWHGVPSIGLRFSIGGEALVFSADTAHDTELWHRLATERLSPARPLSGRDFDATEIIHGDINDYIERAWSEERYQEALVAFAGAAVIHDVSAQRSVVHTDYGALGRTVLEKEQTILTHSPDRMTSEWALSQAGKTFLVKGNRFLEQVGDRLYPLNADVYHKEHGRFFAGFRNPEGVTGVFEKNGLLSVEGDGTPDKGELVYRVDMFEDIAGGYYPRLDRDNAEYRERRGGRVELVEYSEDGSSGRVVESCRERLAGTL
jgi:hypothetical protein